MARAAFLMLGIGLGVGALNLGNEWSKEELQEKRWTAETAPSTRWERMKARAGDVFGVRIGFFLLYIPQSNFLVPGVQRASMGESPSSTTSGASSKTYDTCCLTG
jgi:hypothetical protein